MMTALSAAMKDPPPASDNEDDRAYVDEDDAAYGDGGTSSGDTGDLVYGDAGDLAYDDEDGPLHEDGERPLWRLIRRGAFCAGLLLAGLFAIAPTAWFLHHGSRARLDSPRPPLNASDISAVESAGRRNVADEPAEAEARKEFPEEPTAFGTSLERQAARNVLSARSADQPIEDSFPTLPETSLPASVPTPGPSRTEGFGVPAGAFDALFNDIAKAEGSVVGIFKPEAARAIARKVANPLASIAAKPVVSARRETAPAVPRAVEGSRGAQAIRPGIVSVARPEAPMLRQAPAAMRAVERSSAARAMASDIVRIAAGAETPVLRQVLPAATRAVERSSATVAVGPPELPAAARIEGHGVPAEAFDSLFNGFFAGGSLVDPGSVKPEPPLAIGREITNPLAIMAVEPEILALRKPLATANAATRSSAAHVIAPAIVSVAPEPILAAKRDPSGLRETAPASLAIVERLSPALAAAPEIVSIAAKLGLAAAPGAHALGDAATVVRAVDGPSAAAAIVPSRLIAARTGDRSVPAGTFDPLFNEMGTTDGNVVGIVKPGTALAIARALANPLASIAAEPGVWSLRQSAPAPIDAIDTPESTQWQTPRIPRPRPTDVAAIPSWPGSAAPEQADPQKPAPPEQPAASQRPSDTSTKSPVASTALQPEPQPEPQSVSVAPALPPALLPTRPPRSGTNPPRLN